MLIFLIILGLLGLMIHRDIDKAYYDNRSIYGFQVSSSILTLSNVLRLVFILASVLANINIGAKILLISYFISFSWILNAYYDYSDIDLYAGVAVLAAFLLLVFSTLTGALLL